MSLRHSNVGGENLKEIQEAPYLANAGGGGEADSKKSSLSCLPIPFEGVEFVSQLGVGTFGAVQKVRTRGRLMALKTVAEGWEMELLVLETIQHPFIINYFGYLQFEGRHSFFLELAAEDLRGKLVRSGYFSREEVGFYIVCIVSGLWALHRRKILYRDLKPDNCLLDNQGYVKLTDFGSCSFMQHGWCYGVRGSYGYMAPEVLNHQWYGVEADYYSLGVLIYECVDGFDKERSEALQRGEDLIFSQYFFSDPGNEYLYVLIDDLVEKDPLERPTTGILGHNFFRNLDIDIQAVQQRRAAPPQAKTKQLADNILCEATQIEDEAQACESHLNDCLSHQQEDQGVFDTAMHSRSIDDFVDEEDANSDGTGRVVVETSVVVEQKSLNEAHTRRISKGSTIVATHSSSSSSSLRAASLPSALSEGSQDLAGQLEAKTNENYQKVESLGSQFKDLQVSLEEKSSKVAEKMTTQAKDNEGLIVTDPTPTTSSRTICEAPTSKQRRKWKLRADKLRTLAAIHRNRKRFVAV